MNLFIHGFHVATDLQIAASISHAEPDVVVSVGSGPPLVQASPLVARLFSSDARTEIRMQVSGSSPRWVIEWPGFMGAEILVDANEPTILHFVVPPIVSPDFVELLLSPAIGVLAMLRDAPVLHGSAIAVEDSGVLLLADVGKGKSSITSLLCSSGAFLVSEDVCVLGISNQVYSGTHELRLRENNDWLTHLDGLTRGRTHVDGRIAMRATPYPFTSVSLRATLMIALDQTIDRVEVDPVALPTAVAILNSFQRVPAVLTHPLARVGFSRAADVGASVPTWQLRVPWAPERRGPHLAAELRAAVDSVVATVR